MEENLKKVQNESPVGEVLSSGHLATPTFIPSATMQLTYTKVPSTLFPQEVIYQLKLRLPVLKYLSLGRSMKSGVKLSILC